MRKKILALIGLAAVLALGVQAQEYKPLTGFPNGGTNNIIQDHTNTYGLLGVTKYGDLALHYSFKMNGLGVENLTFVWVPTLDGTNLSTFANQNIRHVVAANGTTKVDWITNLTVNSIGYYKLYVENGVTTNAVTNLIVRPWVKPSRYGS